MRWVWFNGEIVPEDKAKLSIYDSALMFGDMVFEMTRSFRKKQFMLKEHLERLFRSINYVRIPMEYTIDELEQACHDIQEKNDFEPEFGMDDEHRLMINVTRGILPMYSDTGRVGTNVMISDFPLRWTTAGMGKLFDVGINAVTPSQRAIPAHLLDPKVKSRSRLHYQMANIEVSNYEGENNWPLLLDPDGFIAESTGANIFIVHDGLLYTSLNSCLQGISQRYVIEIGAEVANLDLHNLYNAQEAFFTATPFCMLPISSVNGRKIGNGRFGFYKNILRDWSEDVGVDIKAQIQEWDKGAKEGPSAYKFK